MFKKLFTVLTLSFLLIACTDEATNDNTVEVNKEVVEKNKKTAEQYLSEFQNSPIYLERILAIEDSFLESVDFEGDEVPEMVLVTNDDITHCVVTIYKFENDQWIEYSAINYESMLHVYLEPMGKLSYDDGSLKEAFAFERREAHATTMSQNLSILNYNEKDKIIEELINIPLQPTETYNENLEGNLITVSSKDGYTQNYFFKNGEIVDNNGNRLGIIIDKDLSVAVGTTINDHYIRLTDNYYVAQNKIKETLIIEEYEKGAMCSFYETFFICDYHIEGGGMYAYYITPKNEVTAGDLSNIFNQAIEIEEWENMMEGGYSYSAEITTDSGLYSLTFDGNSPDSTLTFISYVPNT